MRRLRAARALKRKRYPDTPPAHPNELECPRCEHLFQCTDHFRRHRCMMRSGDETPTLLQPPTAAEEDCTFLFFNPKIKPRQYPGLPEKQKLNHPDLFDHMFRRLDPHAPVTGVDTGVRILTDTLPPFDRTCMVTRALTPDQRRAREIHEAHVEGRVLTLSPGGGRFTFNGGAVTVEDEEPEIMIRTKRSSRGSYDLCEFRLTTTLYTRV